MSSIPPDARQLARLTLSFGDRALAVAFVRHELVRMGPDAGAGVLGEVAARAEARDVGAAELLLAMSIALASPELEALRAEIAAVAERHGDRETARRLTPGGGTRTVESDGIPVPDFGRGRPLALGERKSLARHRDRGLLARVLRDPHPDVIRILLGNPALIEADVVRLCARRPLAGEVVREVFRSPRWMVRDAVRVAIVRNPYSPLDLALSLAPHLKAQDLREVASSPELHDALRAECARLVQPRTFH